ncbi:unnamed protein product [Malus baccata var. baccata]
MENLDMSTKTCTSDSSIKGFVSDSSGDKKETLAPLVFFGTTCAMLDIIMGITQCEREHAECQAKLLEAQTSATDASFAETGVET